MNERWDSRVVTRRWISEDVAVVAQRACAGEPTAYLGTDGHTYVDVEGADRGLRRLEGKPEALWVVGSHVPGWPPDVDTSRDVMTWSDAVDTYCADIAALIDDGTEDGGQPWVDATVRVTRGAIPSRPQPFRVAVVVPDGWERLYYVQLAPRRDRRPAR
ncbi:hypothetical protein [Cellulomonas sp. HD19AZ1]|uniref:hypothetical protein n=1 Tax=Cellulomonas sp. HD19AZ1 TaxID=2559593 RepID=UPI00107115D0|nr:hypothetical protein [Cellulomonas sp. HD19AZ1]TFH68144.1 hypothetical protein E4A51_18030 [Cellulomonas sp. HD19AZ1]